MTATFTETIQGFRVCGLRSQGVEVRVMPDLGAKMSSLVHRPSGREWMWAPPGGPRFFRNTLGDGFADSTLVGADEIIPTLAACRWRGRELPSHGEAWPEAWELLDTGLAEGLIVTRLRLPLSPLELERAISLEGDTVRLGYRLSHTGDEPYEYLWALHPLLAIREGDRILLPPECRTVRTEVAINCAGRERGMALAWPDPDLHMHLDRLDLGSEKAAIKMYTEPLSKGYAALYNQPSGEYIAFAFDVGALNTVGIWINRGGWSGYHHVALEPTNGAPDPLDVAVNEWRRFARIEPGETRVWHLSIHLGMGTDADRVSGWLAQTSRD